MAQPLYQQPDEAQMRREIEEKLKTDASFLRIVHSMMWAYSEEKNAKVDPAVDIAADGTPIKRSEFISEADAIVEDVLDGNFTTIEALREKKQPWELSTK